MPWSYAMVPARAKGKLCLTALSLSGGRVLFFPIFLVYFSLFFWFLVLRGSDTRRERKKDRQKESKKERKKDKREKRERTEGK